MKPVSGTCMTRSVCPIPGLPSMLLLLVLASQLGGGEAGPVPQKFRIIGRGRADLGETVTLSCQFLLRSSAASPSSYVWIKDGEVIPGETRGTLTFKPVTTQDAGIYQCGDPTSNLERLEHDLYVSGARLPRPEVHVLGVEVLGRSFPMECVMMKGYLYNAKTAFTWYKDGAEIQGQSGQVMRFPRVREADEGKYTCTVREGPVETTSPHSPYYHLLPLVSPELRITPASPDNVTKGILGENLTLTCEVARAFPGVPADGFSWSYLPSPQGPRRPLVGKANTLILGPLTKKDGGQYFCQARNDQIFPQHNLNLTGHASITVRIVYLENITLTSDLEVKKVKKGDPVTLTCSIDSHPAARLVWIMQGQEVRQVTDDLDRYFIPHAGCSDSTSYMCRASNTDLPGREMSASTRLHVQPCNTGPVTSDKRAAEVSAAFDFWLPNKTSLVVVHPKGQEILTVQQNSSFNISSAFLPRLLHPRCDPEQHFLAFTLVKVTEEDEGNYTVMKEGEKERTQMLAQELRLTRAVQEGTSAEQIHSWTGSSIALTSVLACLVLGAGVFLGVKYRRHFLQLSTRVRRFFTVRRRRQGGSAPPGDNSGSEDAQQMTPLMQTQRDKQETQSMYITGRFGLRRRKVSKEPSAPKSGSRKLPLPQGGVENFEVLYRRGQVYVVPPLPDCPAQQHPLAIGQAELDSGEDRQGWEREEAKVYVLQLLLDLLKKHVHPDDPPIFVFTQALPCCMHAIIYHSKLGVIIVKTKAVSKSDSPSILKKAAKELEEAREKVKSQLGGLLGPEAITLLLALPSLENKEDLKESIQKRQSNKDIQLLLGRKRADFEAWLEKLLKRQDHTERVWRRRPDSYQAFITAVSKYLCLEGYSHSQTKGRHTRLLVTPEQAAVLHCTDKWLHIWGPPGSGKTLLVLDRVRWWLRRGKTVVLAICNPRLQLLLHRLGMESLRELTTDTASRLTLCCDPGQLQKTLRELGQHLPPSSVCIFIDNLDSQIYSVLPEASRSAAVECVWTAGQRDLPAPVSAQLQSLGGRSVRLPHPLRIHPALLPLTRELLTPGPLTPDLTDPPCPPARLSTVSVKVTRHSSHPNYRALEQVSSAFDCNACSQWLASSLSPLVERLPLEDERWRHWVILLTGDWGSRSQVMTKLITWLRQQGVPAVQEWKPDSRVSSLPASILLDPSHHQESKVSKDGTALRARVLTGKNREGRPAVHVIPVSHFTGLEKAGVLAVHYDWRDDHPDHRSQEKRDARLSKHRDQLFQAVTRCQTELAVWLLSPSPAASLLQGHVKEGREEQPAGTPEATGAAEQRARLADQAGMQRRRQV